ncbi:hypothetical protein LOK49_LG03G02759 [Camellia lanceoleosa]|uniref:Uncharacterized protein n=1 Tax=Camellia lanceoleosa TaxID=1840588 RepID=A0ACC0IK86_9ERIC|nr:hypothetical protein LOK49_LG03G02759 [Camellia lanceoleosa]
MSTMDGKNGNAGVEFEFFVHSPIPYIIILCKEVERRKENEGLLWWSALEMVVVVGWRCRGWCLQHFMDKKEPGKEASENVARESLIAISYHLPEKDLASEVSPENLHRKDVEGINDGVEERYRSKLISISDSPSPSPSPDTKSVPVAKGDNIKD